MNSSRSVAGSLSRAWRSLLRRPGYFAIAVSSLAIALGLATTVIAQIDSLLHPFTPLRDPDHTYAVHAGGLANKGFPKRRDAYEALNRTGLFATLVPYAFETATLEIGQSISRQSVMLADRPFFDLLGIAPRLGRVFAEGDTFESGIAVVSDRFWRTYFGGAATLDNAGLRIGDSPFKVVGVLGPEWDAKNRGEPDGIDFNEGVWVPPRVGEQDPTRFTYNHFIAQLKTGVKKASVDSAFSKIRANWLNEYGMARPPFDIGMETLRPDPLRLRGFQRAMMAAALFILLIASANVGALSLARGVANRRDQALRLALGAERRDLIQDVTAEIGILVMIGGIIGIGVAYASMGILSALAPDDLSWLGFSEPNWSLRVFAGLFAAAVLSVAVCAIGPSWYVSRIAPAEPLKESSGTTTGRAHSRFQLLIVGELALSMILLFGASLIGKTVHRVATYDFGYDPTNIAHIRTGAVIVDSLPTPSTDPRLRRYRRNQILRGDLEAVVERLRQSSGVNDAAWFAKGLAADNITISDATMALDSVMIGAAIYNVGGGFLRTLGLPLVAGRDFVAGDAVDGAVILDEKAAARLFPDGSAIGRRVKLGPAKSRDPWMPVVGVARNAVHGLPPVPELDTPPVIYASRKVDFASFVIRGARGSIDIGPSSVRMLQGLLPPGVMIDLRKWSGDYDSMLAGRRFTGGIFMTLSLASLVLATAGLFGVLSFAVGQRMREFSLRVALGAQKPHMLRLVFRDSFVMALGGTAIGAFVGLYLGFEVWDWLWGVYPVDPTALIIAESVLLAVTFGASTLPALRATRADPAEVMRAI